MCVTDAFINGIKPSVWLIYPDEKYDISRLIRKYPSAVIKRNNEDFTHFWFFCNRDLKRKFKENQIARGIATWDMNHKIIGELLGFPPRAIDNFIKINEDPNLHKNKIGVSYGGIHFMSYEDSIIDDLMWLKSKHEIENSEIEVRYYYNDVNNDLKLKINEILAQ